MPAESSVTGPIEILPLLQTIQTWLANDNGRQQGKKSTVHWQIITTGMEFSPTFTQIWNVRAAQSTRQTALLTWEAGQLRTWTWADLAEQIARLTAYLDYRQIPPHEPIGSWAENSRAWVVLDLALLIRGNVHVAIPRGCPARHAVEHLGAAGAKRVYVAEQDFLPLRSALLAGGQSPSNATSQINSDHWRLYSLDRWLSADFAQRLPMVKATTGAATPTVHPGDLATIVFTSGTIGTPIGVQLSQQALLTNAFATVAAFENEPTGRRLCWLPLAHLYARTADLYVWLLRGSQMVLAAGPHEALRLAPLTQPEFMNGVPLFYDRLRKYALAQNWPAHEIPTNLQKLLGGKIRLLVAGGAPLSPTTENFFWEQGLPLVAGYGLTEAGPVVSTGTLAQYRAGSVGQPLPDVQVRIVADAPDSISPTPIAGNSNLPIPGQVSGEIQVRTPSLLSGFLDHEELFQTRVTDGWLATGDLGHIDPEGYLYVTGRKKEVLALSSGHKIQPARLEQRLSQIPLIAQVLVIGEGYPCLGALIVPEPEALRQAIRERRIWVWSRAAALRSPAVKKLYLDEIAAKLSDCLPHEQIRKVALLDRAWTVESGELTASLKPRRTIILQNQRRLITEMYAGG
ncbi:MAG: AMP-binding protein [Pirellulales bacterium]|nr:AMP-binding protein [Pirellulales bacterium]